MTTTFRVRGLDCVDESTAANDFVKERSGVNLLLRFLIAVSVVVGITEF